MDATLTFEGFRGVRTVLVGVVMCVAVAGAAVPVSAGAGFPVAATGAPLQAARLSETLLDTEVLQAKLREAQGRMRRGEQLFFELLSGAPASFEATNRAPREVFLAASFDHPRSILKPRPDTFRIEFADLSDGMGVWDVTVTLDFHGNIARVELFNRPPHPF